LAAIKSGKADSLPIGSLTSSPYWLALGGPWQQLNLPKGVRNEGTSGGVYPLRDKSGGSLTFILSERFKVHATNALMDCMAPANTQTNQRTVPIGPKTTVIKLCRVVKL
jgi:hypothetical protein